MSQPPDFRPGFRTEVDFHNDRDVQGEVDVRRGVGSCNDDAPTATTSIPTPPQWHRPTGVATGTWDYVHQRSIADHYDAFVADTPLCRLDLEILGRCLPPLGTGQHSIVLDLGCGSGRTAINLAKAGYDVIAIDLSREMLRVMIAKMEPELLEPELHGKIHPLQANLVQLDCLADNSCDHAVCLFSTLGMIQGRDNRRSVLNHAARICRSGGTLILHVHHRWAALREPRGLRKLAASACRAVSSRSIDFGDATYAYRGIENMFLHRYSRRELVQDLRSSGWKPIQLWRLSVDGSCVDRKGILPGGFIVHCLAK